MLTGKRLHLTSEIPAIDEATQTVVRLKAGEYIEVVSGPSNPTNMLTVRWGDKTLHMFLVDVKARTAEMLKMVVDTAD